MLRWGGHSCLPVTDCRLTVVILTPSDPEPVPRLSLGTVPRLSLGMVPRLSLGMVSESRTMSESRTVEGESRGKNLHFLPLTGCLYG